MTNSSSPETTQQTEDILYFFYIWIIPITIGLPGNILAVLVANRKHNRKLSPCIYIMAMGVADTVLLLERINAIIVNLVFLDYDRFAQPLWWYR